MMQQRRTIALLVLIGFWAVVLPEPGNGRSPAESDTVAAADRPIVSPEGGKSSFPGSILSPTGHAPPKAYELLAQIRQRNGRPLPGYVGGKDFLNRERKLPRGFYREYDIYPKYPGRSRGPERIVIEKTTGKAYYTGDHYRTFIPLN